MLVRYKINMFKTDLGKKVIVQKIEYSIEKIDYSYIIVYKNRKLWSTLITNKYSPN